eukprot:TRINITY_DN5567_c0_g1_i1.p1 TRINITY_DN5567_c0_g1~~TRINITY_DN5567_c0_g1_i1.p1  ORF type:complete len:389 (+),score=108.86 TRINITY_DN5567_c0_g1_i1:68-1234(+)
MYKMDSLVSASLSAANSGVPVMLSPNGTILATSLPNGLQIDTAALSALNLVHLTPMESPPNGTKRDRKRSRDEEKESPMSRAEQQRVASKRYREKKKVLVEQLEEKMKKISEEKERIEREHNSVLQMVEELRKENSTLRKPRSGQADQLQTQKSLLLGKLAELMRNKDGTPNTENPPSDEAVQMLLIPLTEVIKKLVQSGECDHCFAMNPTVVAHLVNNGFFEQPPNMFDVGNGSREQGIRHLHDKIVEVNKDLSAQQKEQLSEIVDAYYKQLEDLHSNRTDLTKNIGRFMESNDAGITTPDKNKDKKDHSMPEVLEAMASLESLRKSLEDEVQRNQQTSLKLMNVLKPRQQATFFLEMDEQQKNILKLKRIWEAMKGVGTDASMPRF